MARNHRHPIVKLATSNRKVRRYQRAAASTAVAVTSVDFYIAIAVGCVFFSWYFARLV